VCSFLLRRKEKELLVKCVCGPLRRENGSVSTFSREGRMVLLKILPLCVLRREVVSTALCFPDASQFKAVLYNSPNCRSEVVLHVFAVQLLKKTKIQPGVFFRTPTQ